ncbi:MAG: hypothetical protein H0U95_05225 [Bacteroidetes bacterium]|nr:hypothetical protein [Bacteroidota bacterium]
MAKKISILLLFFLFAGHSHCYSQKTLEILITRFGKLKKFEVHNGEFLEYKLKGQFSYHRNKITNLQDSLIVFSNDSVIKLEQLKAIRLKNNIHLVRTFQTAFIGLGAGFFFLNTTNNLINDRSPAIDPLAVMIGAGLIGTGLLIKQIGIKRIRINGRKHLKIIDLNLNNLSEKP